MSIAFKRKQSQATRDAAASNPVQYVVPLQTKSGPKPGTECRYEVICAADGRKRVWVDDGYSEKGPNQMRRQIERNLQDHDEGRSMWYVREPLQPWVSGVKDADGDRVTFQPPRIPVLDEAAKKQIEENLAMRKQFMGEARKNRTVSGLVEVKANNPLEVIDTTQKKGGKNASNASAA